LIGESTALTAAHCVYDHHEGGWFDQGIIYPGYSSRGAPYGEYEVEDAIILDGYIDNWSGKYDWNVIPYDMAVIKLSGKPGRRLGTIPIGNFDPARDFTGNIVGYPGDKPYGTMWRSSCSFNAYNVDATTAEHFCDTAPGNSGSSVYDYEKRNNSRVIVGIDVAGSSNSQTAVYFDDSYFFWICNAVHDFEGRDICL
jgi:V8-like Glu-specific endopeptidase